MGIYPTTPKHLGGHQNKTWVDFGALNWAQKKFNVKSMLDIGCGPGGMIAEAEKLGIVWYGIDGDPALQLHIHHPNFILWDFSYGKPGLTYTFDLAWSVEFLEHVEEKYQAGYMSCFARCNHAIVTAAPPGHVGYHHVNLQNQDYWIEKFGEWDFKFSQELTDEMKKHSTMIRKHGKISFIEKTGMVFLK